MAKKASAKPVLQEDISEEAIIEAKKSARELIEFGAEGVIEDIDKAQVKLKELAVFARNANRPHKHFTVFANDLDMFVKRFKRMLR